MGLFDDDMSKGRARSFRPSCEISCNQCLRCTSPKLAHIAEQKGGVLFISDEPTTAQDRAGEAFVGTYRSLMDTAEEYGYPADKLSFCFANACKGTGISSLKGDKYMLQLESCHDVLMESIRKAEPSIIVTLGEIAWDALKLKSFTGRLDGLRYTEDIAYSYIPDQDMRIWIATCLSPKQIAMLAEDRQTEDTAVYYRREYKRMMKRVFTEDWSVFPDYSKLGEDVRKCESVDEAKSMLRKILKAKPAHLAFDYETEGLKLEREDLDIVCVGLACEGLLTSMDWYKDDEEFVSLFRQVMTDPEIGKIAHHAKYEARCTLDKMHVLPEPWAWDSMYGARILNNKKRCGLKPLVYLTFGISGYDSIEWCLETPEVEGEEERRGSNHRNSLMRNYKQDADVRSDALYYVAQDALFSLLLSERQMAEMEKIPHLKKGEQLFRSLINPLVNVEVHGMVIDRDKVEENTNECNKIYEGIVEKINSDPMVKKLWDEELEDHSFDFNSSSDLGHLLYELAGEEKAYTAKGKYLLDSATLERMPYPVTDSILEARRIAKIRDTYLANLERESVWDSKEQDYILHAVNNLHVADTFRSSSSGGINLQNIPSHDKRALSLVRSCILPQRGRCILGGDFRALEVTIGCSIHHDRNMLSFLESGGDMHRATLLDTFVLTPEEADAMPKDMYKKFRGYAKRENFCFFYGGGAKLMGNTLWKDANHEQMVMEHLEHKRLGDYDRFMAHIREVLTRLWEKQFPQYGQWRKDIYAFYQKHGYVDLVDGFRCYGPMSSMQATNAPIQGPASHVLLWSLGQIDRELTERKMQSYVVNQIHDAMYLSVVKDEEEEVKRLMRKWMCEESANHFPWISSPLAVEVERTEYREDGGNWSQEIELGMV